MGIRPVILVQWTLVILLIGVGWTGWCEQPFCSTIAEYTRPTWADLVKQPTAVISALGLIVTIFLHGKNLKATQLSNSAKMVLDAFARFDGKEMRERRKTFATALKRDQAAVQLIDETPVLDFFEDIAHLVQRGVLDEEMVWNTFGWWVSGYHRAVTVGNGAGAKNLILALREASHREDFFKEFEDLSRRITERRRHKEPKAWTAKNDADFLAEEASLAIASEATPQQAPHPLTGLTAGDLANGNG